MKPLAGTTVPKWTNYVVTDLGGRDPLGLSRVSFMITDYLVTGIITTTSRARYYSFYPWALWHIDNLERPKRYADFTAAFRRREAFLALSTLHHNPDSAGVVGADAVRARLSKYRESKEVDTNFAVLPSNSLGGFGQYYAGSLYALGLTHRDENGIDHAEAGRGVALAEAFNRSIARTKYYRQGYFAETDVPFEVLKKSASQFSLDCLSEELANQERVLLRNLLFAWDKSVISDTDLLRRHTLGLILDTISEYGKLGFKPSSDNVDHFLVYPPYYYGAVWRDGDSAQPYKPPSLFADCHGFWQQFPAADRGGDRGSSRDGGRLPEVSRDRGAFAGKLGTKIPAKTGHFGDHRLGQFKTGHGSDHRLRRTSQQFKSGHFSDHRLFAVRSSFGTGRQAHGQQQ